jgi:hypothetical protein
MNKTNSADAGTNRNLQLFEFPTVKKRRVQAAFDGGNTTSDAGLLLLRQVERKTGFLRAAAKALPDSRDPDRIEHSIERLLTQRVFGLCLGYEDLNDHDELRTDIAWQTAARTDRPLASSPTLCRWENQADRDASMAFNQVLVDQFIDSFAQAPQELILDFDATDDRVHGQQEGRFYNGYYHDYCFLPLYVFCGQRLLVAYLRPSNQDAAKHAWAILKLLSSRLRQAWPKVSLTLRADSGFCRWKMLRWCDKHNVSYVVGLARNSRLAELAQDLMLQAEGEHEKSGDKQRLFKEIQYAAGTWDKERRVIVKAEHGPLGSNPRYVVTNLDTPAQELYDEVYCARGEMENRIKEQQLGLFSDRTSCQAWWANQFRVLLSACAYTVMERLRALGLKGTQLAKAQAGTIRLRLLKLGAVITRNTRRVRFHLSSCFSQRATFEHVIDALNTT